MAKTIIKELIIVLLLCLAIILLLGIVLYEYVPMAKTIPNQVSYSTPEDTKQILAVSSEIEENQIVMTYEVDSRDLNNYRRTNEYKPGKANPFSSYQTPSTNTTQNGSTTGTNTENTNNSNNTQNSGSSSENTTTSGGQFFQDKGTK